MTVQTADLRRMRFDEQVRASPWGLVLMGSAIAAVAGSLAFVAVSGSMTGADAFIFYPVMIFTLLLLLFVTINFTALGITVTDNVLEFNLGLLRKRIDLADIESAEAAPYRAMQYGGWGWRFAMGGRRAWTLPFIKTGVAVTVMENGNQRHYYLSSLRPEQLASAITSAKRDLAAQN
ncbi:MAG: DUF3093 family protein [Dehalococcoidia bacterium]